MIIHADNADALWMVTIVACRFTGGGHAKVVPVGALHAAQVPDINLVRSVVSPLLGGERGRT